MIRVSTCERCGETRVERNNVTACLGCGYLKWPGGRLYFGRKEGRSPKLEILVTLLRRTERVRTDGLRRVLWLEPDDRASVTLRSHISKLRALLAGAGFPGAIEAEFAGCHSRGYRIVLHQPTEAAA